MTDLPAGRVAAWRVSSIGAASPAPTSATVAAFAAAAPAGWYALGESASLARGDVLGTSALGQDLVVWRGEDGRPRALPARCPHAFADMADGGRVHGNWIECPFHGWRFDDAGMLRDVPYSVKPIVQRAPCPPRLMVKDAHGLVLVCHHPDQVPPPPSVNDPGGVVRVDGEWLIENCAPGTGILEAVGAGHDAVAPPGADDRAGPGLIWLNGGEATGARVLVAMTPVAGGAARVWMATTVADGHPATPRRARIIARRLDRLKAAYRRAARTAEATSLTDA